MDTNLIAEVVRLINAAEPKTSAQWWVNFKEILPVFLTALMGLVVWYQKRHDDKLKEQSSKLELQQKEITKTSGVVDEIKVEVNHERTEMINKLEVMNGAFLDVAKENATFREQKRVSDAAIVASALIAKGEPPVKLEELRALLHSMIASEMVKSETKDPL